MLALLALFAGSQLALSWLVESGAPVLRDPEFFRRLANLRYRQAEHPGHPLTVALGSSRVGMALRPDVLAGRLDRPGGPLLFNFGIIMGGPVMQRINLDRLLRVGVRPDCVIVEFWPTYFAQVGVWSEETLITGARFDWDDIDLMTQYARDPSRYEKGWRMTRVVPVSEHRFVLMSLAKPSWLSFPNRLDFRWSDVDHWGWKPSNNRPFNLAEKQFRVESARRDFVPVLAAEAPNPVSIRAFDDLLETCRREGIPAVVVWLPEGSEFRSWYRPATERWAADLFAGYGTRLGVRTIDARCWSPDDDLLDEFHLTPDAAKVFTERFWSVISREGRGAAR